MNRNKISGFFAFLVIVVGCALPVSAQQTAKAPSEDNTQMIKVQAGQKQKFRGVIVKRDIDNFIVRDEHGIEVNVALNNNTKVEEKKSNPFRRPRNYATTELMRGLSVEVEGKGDANGALNAEKVKFTDEALVVAKTVETRVTPVEGRVTDAETRLSEAEQNSQRLSGQIEELQQISNAARGGARAAQETADLALASVNRTNERITTLVSSLDEYEAKKGATVNFLVNSAKLQPEAMATLDEIANQAKTERGFIIEVMGFASADGKADLNRKLSQDRADAVVRYLAENHMIPLRRIITPFGYGAAQPVADNTTREGREQNRRVEVKILVNRGLTSPAPPPATKSVATSSASEPVAETTTATAGKP
jgi:outer membrane protein OmpA-like peptidoglycan-associated protein